MQPTHDKMPHLPCFSDVFDLSLAVFCKGERCEIIIPHGPRGLPALSPPIIVLHFFQVVIAASIVGVGARAMCLLAGFNRPSLPPSPLSSPISLCGLCSPLLKRGQ